MVSNAVFFKKVQKKLKKENFGLLCYIDGRDYIDSIDNISNMGRSCFWGCQFAAMSDKIGSLAKIGWLYVSGFGILG